MEMGKLKRINLSFKFFLIVITCLMVSCQGNYFENDLAQILGVEKIEIKNRNIINEQGGSQGDGFILEVYELSDVVIRDFLSKSKNSLPEKPDTKHTLQVGWSKTPIDTSYNEVLILALNYSSENNDLNAKLSEIKKVLEKENTYYSFYYRPDKDNPNYVQIFVLDTEQKTLYAIDQQI